MQLTLIQRISSLVLSSLLLTAPAITCHAAEPSGNSTFPLQLEARVPFAPTAFPSADNSYVVYELYLTNFSASPMSLRRIEVLDADRSTIQPVLVLEGEQLNDILQPVGAQPSSGVAHFEQLDAGATAVAYMWVQFGKDSQVPRHLRHRIVTADNSVETDVIDTHHTRLLVLSPPVHGTNWMASDGPSNDRDNHHRRGNIAIDGQEVTSRRYAIDWFHYVHSDSQGGDVHDPHSYPSYGESVYAVGNATVVAARNTQPDNVPGPVATFRPTVPITMDTVAGNFITLDLGGGRYAWYLHLQPGSVLVKAGDHVHAGQQIAKIGCSGDAPVPHLHFEITTSAKLVAGEGIPYVIDHYRVSTGNNVWDSRNRELPLNKMLVDFARDDRGVSKR